MKLLWFTNTPSLFEIQEGGYNGGGWITSLEREMSQIENIELAVAFLYPEEKKVVKGNVAYYLIHTKSSILSKIQFYIDYETYRQNEIKSYLKVIHDFKPDVIHIFGSESTFGLVREYTDIPIVLHIQGIMNPYLNTCDLPGIGKYEFLKYLKIKEYKSHYLNTLFFKRGAVNEQKIFSLCHNFMGRTQWDKNVANLLSFQKAHYFHCDEILRPPFYTASAWNFEEHALFKIVTTISKTDYKGFDLILKTARLLKTNFNLNFEWNVYGIGEYSFWEKKLKIKALDVDVFLKGVIDADQLVLSLRDANVFVHPSYIDNSPNSICEAQMIGVPVISTNVGGISSLIDNDETGILVPANDPYSLACKIMDLEENDQKAIHLGTNARRVAQKRHDVKKIIARNLEIYNIILTKE
ncbi:MAG: glycosyltransferase family 4 protein [Dysgonomonas sp.]